MINKCVCYPAACYLHIPSRVRRARARSREQLRLRCDGVANGPSAGVFAGALHSMAIDTIDSFRIAGASTGERCTSALFVHSLSKTPSAREFNSLSRARTGASHSVNQRSLFDHHRPRRKFLRLFDREKLKKDTAAVREALSRSTSFHSRLPSPGPLFGSGRKNQFFNISILISLSANPNVAQDVPQTAQRCSLTGNFHCFAYQLRPAIISRLCAISRFLVSASQILSV